MITRLCALIIAALSLAALGAQYNVLPYADGAMTVAQRLWTLAGYFTVLTNALIAGHMLAIAIGWQISPSRAAGLVVSICLVGIVYHFVLAQLWNPVGLAWWANQGLHTAVPAATLAWWLAFAPKRVTLHNLPTWLIWPLIYCVYALTRGGLTGFWAYPFLDVDQLGGRQVAANIAGLIVAFAMMGLGILGLATVLRRVSQPDKPS